MSTFLQSQSNTGFDITNQTYNVNDISFDTYDSVVNATTSTFGSSFVVDDGQEHPTMIYNESTVGGERVYNLDAMLEKNKPDTLSNMLDISNNGRVRDLTGHSETSPYVMTDAPVGLVMSMNNQETSIKGLIEDNAVNTLLFSDINMQALQMGIQAGVYQRTNKMIGEQSPQELYMVIRSIMLQYANFQTAQDKVVEEVKRLNEKILAYCIDNVSSNVLQYVQYLKDIDTLPMPLEHPTHVDKPTNYTYDISNLLKRDNV